jgi:hypothetical protein
MIKKLWNNDWFCVGLNAYTVVLSLISGAWPFTVIGIIFVCLWLLKIRFKDVT